MRGSGNGVPRGDQKLSGALWPALGTEPEEDDLFRLGLLDFQHYESLKVGGFDEAGGYITIPSGFSPTCKSEPVPGTYEANFIGQLRSPESSISPVLLIDEFRKRLGHDLYADDEPTQEMLVRAFVDAIDGGGWKRVSDSCVLTEAGSAELSAILMLSSYDIESCLTDYSFVVAKLEKWLRDKSRDNLTRLAAFISLNDAERSQPPAEALFDELDLCDLILDSEARPAVILGEVSRIASGRFWLKLWGAIDLSNCLHVEILSIIGEGLVRAGHANQALECLDSAVPRDAEEAARIKELLAPIHRKLA